MDRFMIGWIILLCLVFGVALSCGNSTTTTPRIETVGPIDVYRYSVGNVTYLVFDKGNSGVGGVAVVNYTQDSLEYEFMKCPTKAEPGFGLLIDSNGTLQEINPLDKDSLNWIGIDAATQIVRYTTKPVNLAVPITFGQDTIVTLTTFK